MKKIGIVTTTRAEYGLLEPLINMISQNNVLEPYLIVTGSHLSQQHGYSKNNIKFPIDEEIEVQLDSDTPCGICKSFALTSLGFADLFKRVKLDGLILLGDRSELLAVAITAYINRVKIFHLHGGEISGNLDDLFRYMISKMASYHFVACENYGERLMDFGISKAKIFNVGALGCDGLFPQAYPRKDELLIIYHPETLQRDEEFEELLLVLNERVEEKIFIFPNVDDGCNRIAGLIKKFCMLHIKSSWFVNLGRQKYLEILSQCQVIIGNSSSGIIEAPALGTPTINVGKRQQGRLKAASIIDCDCNAQSIREAFNKLYLYEFQEMIQSKFYYKPYGGENVAQKIMEIILDVKP